MIFIRNKFLLGTIFAFLFCFSSAVLRAETGSKDLIRDFLSGKIPEEKIYDPDFLEKQLGAPDSNAFEQVLKSFQSGISSHEFLIQREIWKTLVKSNPNKGATLYAEQLAGTAPEKLKAMFEVAASSDYSESSKRPWDFSRYRPILEATKEEPFDRLIAYMLQQSPGDGLKQLVDVYGDDLGAKQKRNIVRKALEITDHLRNHGSLFELRSSPEESFEEGSMGQRALDFFLELKGLDKWYLDVFIVAALEKSGSSNVSPDLIEYFESKPDSLANKLRQDGGIASLPPQKISLESLKNEQGKERENRLRGNNPDNLRKQELSSRSDEKSQRQEVIAEPKKFNLPWIIAGVLLVGILVLLFKMFRGKSTS